MGFYRHLAMLALLPCLAMPATAGEDLRFMHFWASPGELRAVDVLRKSAARAGLDLVDIAIDGDFIDLRSALLASLITGNPPDAAQWIVGDELDELIDGGFLMPVQDNRLDFARLLVPEVYRAVHREDGLSNLPLGIHIENFVVFNRQAFARINRPVPRGWAEFLDDAPALHRAGITPLVMSSQSWQMQNLFPNILSALVDADQFHRYLTDPAPPQDLRPQIVETFRIIAGLRAFAPDPLPDLAFTEGAAMVSRGQAAAYALGDYVVPELLPDAPVTCMVSPGADAVLLGIDGMAFARRGDARMDRLKQDFAVDFYTRGGASDYVAQKGGVSVLAADHEANPGTDCAGQSLRGWKGTPNRYRMDSDSWKNHLRIVGRFTTDFVTDMRLSPTEAADEMLRLMRGL